MIVEKNWTVDQEVIMERCSCWHERDSSNSLDRCFGTKEMDACSCGGDRSKCDFYPEVRNEAVLEARLIELVKRKKVKKKTNMNVQNESDRIRVLLDEIEIDLAILRRWLVEAKGELQHVHTEEDAERYNQKFLYIEEELKHLRLF